MVLVTARRIRLASLILWLLFVAATLAAAKPPHYTFILPNGYVGWVQIIFFDPNAPALSLRRDKGYEIEIPESGISRTSHMRVHDFKRKDEFYYRPLRSAGKAKLFPLPSEYVLPGDSHGGFGVMDTGGKGPGYSWFIFIGPPELRAKVALADYDKVVKGYQTTHGGKSYFVSSDTYPQPGRMPAVVPGNGNDR